MISQKVLSVSKTVSGICGQVDGIGHSGLVGLEAGQIPGLGDVFGHGFKEVLSWPIDTLVLSSNILDE